VPGLPYLDAPLSDGHITLREWTDHDVDAMTAALQDAEIARWTRVPSPYTRQNAVDFLARMRAARAEGTEFSLAVVDPPDGDLIGATTLHINREHLRAEIGTLIFAHARGRGVSPRVGRLMCRFGFEQLSLRRVGAQVEAENVASVVATERAGWKREGMLRSYMDRHGEPVDMVSYSMLPEDL
jgi:RimJ/RimL family protein N-acetyltransferase